MGSAGTCALRVPGLSSPGASAPTQSDTSVALALSSCSMSTVMLHPTYWHFFRCTSWSKSRYLRSRDWSVHSCSQHTRGPRKTSASRTRGVGGATHQHSRRARCARQ
nr:MAG: hypothetical protein [Molluscum contagiosum virus]